MAETTDSLPNTTSSSIRRTGDPIPTREFATLISIERACSVLSLAGCLFTIVVFCVSKASRKPINRLIFYATFGNILSNIGTLISQSYVDAPNSLGCQSQAFLVQMFLPADAFWALAMAINVYLVFYHKFDAEALRRLEIPYIAVCYGIPSIPAFVYLWLSDENGVRVYGNATLWCWVSQSWRVLRIATFYGPIWLIIIGIFVIYIGAGRTIYESRRRLLNLESLSELDPFGGGAHTLRTTEITVVSEPARTLNSTRSRHLQHPSSRQTREHTVTISATKCPVRATFRHSDRFSPIQRLSSHSSSFATHAAIWKYTRNSFLFFAALLITWIPSSVNRVYSVIHGKESTPSLETVSALVLPLQGFWNALIYAVVSWSACKQLMADVAKFVRWGPGGLPMVTRGRSLPGPGQYDGFDYSYLIDAVKLTEVASSVSTTSRGGSNDGLERL